MNFACALKLCLLPRSKLSLCRRLEAEVECLDEPGCEICLCNSNLCNMFLPALRETEPELQYWHALMLLVPVLLALLAQGAFWALRHGRSGSFTVDPNYWKQETETSPRLLTFNTRAGAGEGGNHEQLAIQIDRCSVLLLNYLLAPGLYIYRFVGPHTY